MFGLGLDSLFRLWLGLGTDSEWLRLGLLPRLGLYSNIQLNPMVGFRYRKGRWLGLGTNQNWLKYISKIRVKIIQ